MAADVKRAIQLEIGHVLFIDIVGYSKLLINEQSEQLQTLKEIVRATEQFRIAEVAGKPLRLPYDFTTRLRSVSPNCSVLQQKLARRRRDREQRSVPFARARAEWVRSTAARGMV